MSTTRKSDTEEFKREAVALVEQRGIHAKHRRKFKATTDSRLNSSVSDFLVVDISHLHEFSHNKVLNFLSSFSGKDHHSPIGRGSLR